MLEPYGHWHSLGRTDIAPSARYDQKNATKVAFLLALNLSQRFVGTIAQGFGGAVFATTKVHRLGFFSVVFQGSEFAAFM